MGCAQGKTGVITFGTYDTLANKDNDIEQVVITSSTKNLARESFDNTIEVYSRVELNEKPLSLDMVYISEDKIAYPLIDNNKLLKKTIVDENGKEKEVPDTIEIPLRQEGESTEKYIEEILKANGYNKIDELKQSSNKIKIDKILDIINNIETITNKGLFKEAYSKKIIMMDNSTLMSHSMDGIIPELDGDSKRMLLADEADFAILDDYRPKQKTVDLEPEEVKRRITLRQKAHDILQDAKNELEDKLYVIDEETQYVDFTPEGTKLILKKINENTEINGNKNLNEIFNFTYDALVADTIYKKGRDYQLIRSQSR